jgi:cytochrome P450
MDTLMTDMTLDVILRALFGAHHVTDARPISEAIQTLSHSGIAELFKPFSWPLWMPLPSVRKVRHAKRTLDQLIQQHIQAQPPATEHGGEELLTMLRQARDPENPDQGLSAQELHDQTMVMFQAGHETTATAMTWWSGLIARHPEVADRIHAENFAATALAASEPQRSHAPLPASRSLDDTTHNPGGDSRAVDRAPRPFDRLHALCHPARCTVVRVTR